MSDIHTLSGAYALDALTDVERAAFARHLRECSACASEVAELTETTARLSDPAATAPPVALRERVLSEIGRTRQLGPRRAEPAEATGRWRRWTAAAVAAAMVLLGLGAGAIVEEQRVRDAQHQAARAEQIETVLAAPDAVVHTAPGPNGQGRVTLVVSNARNQAVAVLGGLAWPGADRTYQLWMIRDQQPTDEGTIGSEAGSGTVLVEGVRSQQVFAITNEPAGGSRTPTLPTLVTIELS